MSDYFLTSLYFWYLFFGDSFASFILLIVLIQCLVKLNVIISYFYVSIHWTAKHQLDNCVAYQIVNLQKIIIIVKIVCLQ